MPERLLFAAIQLLAGLLRRTIEAARLMFPVAAGSLWNFEHSHGNRTALRPIGRSAQAGRSQRWVLRCKKLASTDVTVRAQTSVGKNGHVNLRSAGWNQANMS